MVKLDEDERGVIIAVRAQAAARRNGIIGVHGGMLRVAVSAAPERGKANRAIIEVLSEALGVPKSAIELLSGETSSRKRILLVGANVEWARAELARFTVEE